MRQTAILFLVCLLAGWLLGCANRIAPTGQTPPALSTVTDTAMAIPTVKAEASTLPESTSLAKESRGAEKTVVVGQVQFVVQSIIVESGAADAAIVAADFNRDGHQDLVAAGEPQLTLFRGDGRGGLTRYGQVHGGEQPEGFTSMDVDGDEDVDLVIANHDTDYLTLLLNDGTGVFQPAQNSPLRIAISPHPHVVRAAELDGDGLVDLIVDHRDGEGMLILKGLGQGAFESPDTLVEVGGDPYRGMALGDLNGDGKPDLVTPNPGEVGVLLNTSEGELAFVQTSPVPAAVPFAVELGDFNRDGRLDLIAASDEGSPLVELYYGDGRGGFEAAGDSPFQLALGGKNIVVGDFNGDSYSDAAVASYHFPKVLLLWGGQETIMTNTLPGGEHPWGLAAADFNEDGLDDLVIADDGADKALVYLSLRS